MTRSVINMAMRYDEVLSESNHGDWPYYHGTPSAQVARTIMTDGLEPQTVATAIRRKNYTSQAGYVYLSPHVRYALNYAMGFFMEDSDLLKMRIPIEGNEAKLAWMSKEHGLYGFIFVIYASTIMEDLQPDEDVVGSLYNAAVDHEIHWALDGILSEDTYSRAQADPEALARFVAYVESVVSPATRMKLHNVQDSDSAVGWAKKIGKMAVRKMDTTMKAWLLRIGSHAGSATLLLPDECWRFDRRKIGWVESDGSNFFELAERIK